MLKLLKQYSSLRTYLKFKISIIILPIVLLIILTNKSLAIILLAIAPLLVLFGIGRLVRGRSRRVQVPVLVLCGLLVSIVGMALMNSITLAIYDYYAIRARSCGEATSVVPDCQTIEREHVAFQERTPSLLFWLSVPGMLRPDCETISAEFCTLVTWDDFGDLDVQVGLVGGLISAGLVGLGMRRGKNRPETPPETV